MVLLAAWKPDILEIAESHLIDIRFVNRGEISPGPETVIVAIDWCARGCWTMYVAQI